VNGLAWVPMKGVASCDKPRVDACSHRSEDTLMGLPNVFGHCSVKSGNPLNRNILVRGGKEINDISLVVANEKEKAQTELSSDELARMWCLGQNCF